MASNAFRSGTNGFSLSELLIAMLIIGQIATFTIPKVLVSQQNSRYKAIAKEAMASVASAYQMYRLKNGSVPTSFTPVHLLPYLNYVKVDNVSQIDDSPGWGAYECSWGLCAVLHNGAYLYLNTGWVTFGQATPNNYVYFQLDPDGKYSGSTTGPGKSLYILLFYNGRIISGIERQAAYTVYEGGSPQNYGPQSAPDWFSWN